MPMKGWYYAVLEAIAWEMHNRPDMIYFYELHAPRASQPGLPTIDLEAAFGRLRVYNSSINETWYAAAAIGAGMVGAPVVANIPYQGGSMPFELVTQHASKIRYKTGGQVNLPIVLYIGESAQSATSSVQHSDFEYANYYATVPGVKTICPSTVYDAKGMMHAAIRDPDPVVYIYPGRLATLVEDVPDEPYEVPIGPAAVRTEGDDLTIVGYGPVMPMVSQVVEQLRREGVSVETIDLRTLHPLDRDTLVASARKTRRVLTVEATKYSYGIGAELVASIAEKVPETRFRRLAYADAPPPGAPELFNYMAITPERIYDAARAALRA